MTKEEREKAIDLLDNLLGMVEDNQDNDYDFALKIGIESLRQEPCEDCISRETVLMEIDKYMCGVPFDGKGIDVVLKELPHVTPTQRWIPCSERLPKESGFYLVSTTDCITIMEFIGGWISQNLGSCNWYVKAWMPLPPSYKGE